MGEMQIVMALKKTKKGRLFHRDVKKNLLESTDRHPVPPLNSCDISENDVYYYEPSDKKENDSSFLGVKSHDSLQKPNFSDLIRDQALSKVCYSDSIISAYKEEINSKVKNFLLLKRFELDQNDADHRNSSQVNKNILYEKQKDRLCLIEKEENDFNQAFNEELIANQKHLQDSHSRHAELLDKKDSDAQEEINKKDAIRKMKEHEYNKQKMTIERNEILKISQELLEMFKGYKYPGDLPGSVKSCEQIMKAIVEKTDAIASSPQLTEDDVKKVKLLAIEAKKVIPVAKIRIAECIRLEEEKLKNLAKPSHDEVDSVKIENAPATSIPSDSPRSDDLVIHCKEHYLNLLKFYDKVEVTCKEFEENTQHKTYRFNLMKAIGETVNTINDNDVPHLTEKINKLNKLLTGGNVEISGRQLVSTNNHPSAKLFCLNRLAKKLVNQGGELVSSKPDTAFTYASVVVGLWSIHPTFGDLFLVHLALKCPYLVPYSIEKEGRSNAEYFQLLGFNVEENGEIENENKFLKRISGYVTLYAAVTISQPPSNRVFGAQKTNLRTPHGIKKAWLWLARAFGQKPVQGITATALHSFLIIVGSEMFRCYGKQFYKLLLFLKSTYLPKIQEATTDDGKIAPVERLRLFVDEAVSRRFIIKPNGFVG